MGKRQDEALETRQKIVAAAMKLIRKRGFSRTTVAEITAAAGVAKGSFYVHFDSKDDIVCEHFRTYFQRLNREAQEDTGDIAGRLKRYFRRFMEVAMSGGIEISREWIRSVVDPQDCPDDMGGGKYAYDLSAIRELLKRAIAAGELRKTLPIDTFSHLVLCELKGMALCWCMSDGAFDPVAWVDRFSDLTLARLLDPYLVERV